MGITGLKKFLEKHCPHAITERKLSDYSGKKLGIDISIFLYKYLYNFGDHIVGLTRLIVRLLKNKITPIFIFDGKPPKEKDGTLIQRKKRKDCLTIKSMVFQKVSEMISEDEKKDFESFKDYVEEAVQMSSSMNNHTFVLSESDIRDLYEKSPEDIKKESEKLSKKNTRVTHEHIESAKQLLDLFGVKYIHEQCEAESLMALMCKKEYIDGCISEDTDILPCGGDLFLTGCSADNDCVQEYCLTGILEGLGLNYNQFIDLCILLGCDYTSKIYKIGPVIAYDFMKKYGSIEEIISNNKKYIIPDDFYYQRARCLFKDPVSNDIFNNIKKDNNVDEPQIDLLLDFLKTRNEMYKITMEKKTIKYTFDVVSKELMNYFFDIQLFHEFDDSTEYTETSVKKSNNGNWR
jgi:flap endonuclease-1